jgi:diketogulonate reductase-like aldo/keto reductase
LIALALLAASAQGMRVQSMKRSEQDRQDSISTNKLQQKHEGSLAFSPAPTSPSKLGTGTRTQSAGGQAVPPAKWAQPSLMKSQSQSSATSRVITYAGEGTMTEASNLAAREIGQPVHSGGPFPLTVGYGTCLQRDPQGTVKIALKEGYRLIDTAQRYGNEAYVGQAILDSIAEGVVKREDLFLTTKIWIENMGFDKTIVSTRQSSRRLAGGFDGEAGLVEAVKESYGQGKTVEGGIDLMLIHWPSAFVPKGNLITDLQAKWVRQQTWKALEKLQEDGEVKQLGVANFGQRHLEEILSYATIKPTVSQFEIHPYNQRENLVKWCQSQGIAVNAYSPIGGKGNEGDVTDELLSDPVLQKIADSHGKTIAQVILRWHLQRGVTPIPKASSQERIHENRDVFGFELSDADMSAIKGLERGKYVLTDADTFA